MTVLMVAVGCGGRPSVEDARNALRESIDGGRDSRVRLLALDKTDGQEFELMGTAGYQLFFEADAEFVSDAMFSTGSLSANGSRISVSDYQEPATGFSWNDFLNASQGVRPARKGDRLHLNGTVTFEKRESGWVPVSTDITASHDSTTRDMEAIRAKAEERRLREEELDRQARAQEEEALRERDAYDAQAEKTTFLVSGPSKGVDGNGRAVDQMYYVGRVTPHDVIQVEPVSGEYSEVRLYRGSYYGEEEPYEPGMRVPHGRGGGSGSSIKTSGVARFEFRDRGEGIRQAYLEFESPGEMELRVTILCHQLEGDPPCENRPPSRSPF